MSTSLPKYALAFLLLLPVMACRGTAEQVTAPAAATADGALPSSMTVEPQTLHPEFLPSTSCVVGRSFGTRFNFRIRGHQDLILSGLRFAFVDRVGVRALPEVIPIPGLSTTVAAGSALPSSSPIPLPGIAAIPGASPIALPGSAPVNGLFIPSGTARVLPFFVRFGCGVFADGTLIVAVDTAFRGGRFDTSEVRVRVGP